MTTAVLVMSYGTPNDPSEIAAFYTDIRRGRPPSDAEVADLERRYAAIGGLSPLTTRSLAQVRSIEAALEQKAPGAFDVFYATKHATPKIADVVAEIGNRGISRLVGIVLAPHYSALSIGDYFRRVEEAATRADIECAFVRDWHTLPALIELLSERVPDALEGLSGNDTAVVFSAHSLPKTEQPDPYVEQLEESARLVARKDWLFLVGPSDGKAPGVRRDAVGPEWYGPDITEAITTLGDEGASAVLVCPQGFTSDHLEILFDLDIVAAEKAREIGVAFARTASLNDDPRLSKALAALIVATSEGA